MPAWRYIARDEKGNTIRGVAYGSSAKEIFLDLRGRGLFPVDIKKEATFLEGIIFSRKINRKDLMNIFYQISTMLKSGISLTQSLYAISEEATSKVVKSVFRDLAISVESGYRFSEALESYKRIFPKWIISLVRAGEISGDVEKVVYDIARFLEWQQKIVDEVRNALFYPAIVFVAFIALLVFAATFLLPSLVEAFQKIAEGYTVELPLPARIIISLNSFLRENWLIIISAPIVVFIVFRFGIKLPIVSNYIDKIKFSIPVLGRILTVSEFSKFCRYFAFLYGAGLNLSKILDILSEITTSVNQRNAIRRAKELVESGRSLSSSFSETLFFPNLIIQGISTGEKTGELSFVMNQIGEFYDRELSSLIKRFVTMLEPFFLILVASAVGFLLIALVTTIYSMITRIGQ